MSSRKKKKQSNASSKLSNSGNSAPATPTHPFSEAELSEESISSIIELASLKHPSLINNHALVVKIAGVDSETRGGKIWLSQNLIISASLLPSSTVSVSIFSKDSFSTRFPLCSVTSGCSRYSGVEFQDKTNLEAGNYFTLATVFPSSKISKNELRLSFDAFCTLGFPPPGTTLFVCPVEVQILSDCSNGGDNNNSYLMSQSPNELYLEIAPLKIKTMDNFSSLSPVKNRSKETLRHCENGSTSPKTPLPEPLHKSSPQSSAVSDGSAFRSPRCDFDSLDPTDAVVKAMADGKGRKLLQACALSWLFRRSLLPGNILCIPFLSSFYIFSVVSGNESSSGDRGPLDSSPETYVENKSDDSCSENVVYIISEETKLHLRLPRNLGFCSGGDEKLTCMDVGSGTVLDYRGRDGFNLGGLSKEYSILRDIIRSSINSTVKSLGLRPSRGVLLFGPPGTGKTSLAISCALDSGLELFVVKGPEIFSQFHGESEKALHDIFDSAWHASPSVVFIDELNVIAPARREGSEGMSCRMVATLLNLMDGISENDGLVVIAATNKLDSIEPALRRPGRFDHEIEIGVPTPAKRLDILQTLLEKMDHSLSVSQVEHLAATTHGFVGADLASLCAEASAIVLRSHDKLQSSFCCDHHQYSEESSKTCSNSDLHKQSVTGLTFACFEKALEKVRPSAMMEVKLEVPKVKWEDVGGQEEAKKQLKEAVEWPQKHRDAFIRLGARPPGGVLMFGPPGCSKTLMARAIASESNLNFLSVKGPELLSKWVGESEKAVRSLFANAKANSPSVIFFDEIDGLAVARGEDDGLSVSDRVVSQLLVELNGLHQRSDVTVIAATNRPDKIDTALLRPGRFDRLVYVGPPARMERVEIFRIHLRKIPYCSDVDINELSFLTEGFTGADISSVCREAAVAALEENLEACEISMRHLLGEIRKVEPTGIHPFRDLTGEFLQLALSCFIPPPSSGSSWKKAPSAVFQAIKDTFLTKGIWRKPYY